MQERVDTAGKALKINLGKDRYGAFSEVGGGQEVSRWFFRVGGAAGSVAKTMSAYDMTVSDAIYGHGERYVSRERLRSMLDREYSLLVERLAEERGNRTAFFVFADTVSTRSFKGDNECHGWLGLRYQRTPMEQPSDILMHVALRDPTAQRQQESLGILGVNLLHSAFYGGSSRRELLAPLLDELSLEMIEIDVVELHGPAFHGQEDPAAVAADLITLGLAQAVVIDESGKLDQPSTIFRKRAVLVYRAGWGDDAAAERMIQVANAHLLQQAAGDRPPLGVVEVSLARCAGGRVSPADLLGPHCRRGRTIMVSGFDGAYHLSAFIRRSTEGALRYLIGMDGLVQSFREQVYGARDGGMLEALGRLLAKGTRIEVFAMPHDELDRRLPALGVEPGFCSYPAKATVSLSDITLASPAGRLLEYLIESGWIGAAD